MKLGDRDETAITPAFTRQQFGVAPPLAPVISNLVREPGTRA
jgi:hypothetical protein